MRLMAVSAALPKSGLKPQFRNNDVFDDDMNPQIDVANFNYESALLLRGYMGSMLLGHQPLTPTELAGSKFEVNGSGPLKLPGNVYGVLLRTRTDNGRDKVIKKLMTREGARPLSPPRNAPNWQGVTFPWQHKRFAVFVASGHEPVLASRPGETRLDAVPLGMMDEV